MFVCVTLYKNFLIVKAKIIYTSITDINQLEIKMKSI
jgi:hypothetical protein